MIGGWSEESAGRSAAGSWTMLLTAVAAALVVGGAFVWMLWDAADKLGF